MRKRADLIADIDLQFLILLNKDIQKQNTLKPLISFDQFGKELYVKDMLTHKKEVI